MAQSLLKCQARIQVVMKSQTILLEMLLDLGMQLIKPTTTMPKRPAIKSMATAQDLYASDCQA